VIDEDTMSASITLLTKARNHNMIVDLTFDKGDYPQMTPALDVDAATRAASAMPAPPVAMRSAS
jgi:hypothetical protein